MGMRVALVLFTCIFYAAAYANTRYASASVIACIGALLLSLHIAFSESAHNISEPEALVCVLAFSFACMYTFDVFGITVASYGVWLWTFPCVFCIMFARHSRSVFALLIALSEALAACGTAQSTSTLFALSVFGALFFRSTEPRITQAKLLSAAHLACITNVLLLPSETSAYEWYEDPWLKIALLVALKILLPLERYVASWKSIAALCTLCLLCKLVNILYHTGETKIFVFVMLFLSALYACSPFPFRFERILEHCFDIHKNSISVQH